MRTLCGPVAILILAFSFLSARPPRRWLAQSTTPQSTQSTPSPNQQAPQQQQQPPAPQPPPPPRPVLTIILDPAHGGTDSGARGQTGAIEKDVVLQYARTVRAELERQGFRTILTRDDDSNPSYDDRASMANSYREAIFISLHVASTGAFFTARVYYYHFASSPTGPPVPLNESAPATSTAKSTSAANPPAASPFSPLVPWEEAQLPHINTSHHLADVLQMELAQHFTGSPAAPSRVAVRGLRSVHAPAVAIEVSSVSVQDPSTIQEMAAPLAASIARGLQAFKSAAAPAPGGK